MRPASSIAVVRWARHSGIEAAIATVSSVAQVMRAAQSMPNGSVSAALATRLKTSASELKAR